MRFANTVNPSTTRLNQVEKAAALAADRYRTIAAQAPSSGRGVLVATLKFERLVTPDLPFDAPQAAGAPYEAKPSANFMLDVNRMTREQKGIRKMNLLIAANPFRAANYIARGNLYYRISAYSEALQDYSRALQVNPTSTSALVNRGAVRRKTGDLTGAIADYDSALALMPADVAALRNRGIARELLGDTEGAFQDWAEAASLGDGDAAKWIALSKPQLPAMSMPVQTLLQMHSSQAGLAEQSAVENPISAEDFNVSQRSRELTLALLSDPSDHVLLLRRGTELLKRGSLSLAIKDFSSVLRLMPNSLKATFNRAVARRKVGDLSGALADYDRVIQLDPEDSDAYRNRGIVKQMLGSQAGACADWGVAAALGEKEVKPWIQSDCQ